MEIFLSYAPIMLHLLLKYQKCRNYAIFIVSSPILNTMQTSPTADTMPRAAAICASISHRKI
jgi:hypothetical protein